jgi:hypothetical protein
MSTTQPVQSYTSRGTGLLGRQDAREAESLAPEEAPPLPPGPPPSDDPALQSSVHRGWNEVGGVPAVMPAHTGRTDGDANHLRGDLLSSSRQEQARLSRDTFDIIIQLSQY